MYLSIDLGDKKCGFAIFLEGIIIPKGIIPRVKIIDELKKLINKYNIKIIVVGLPFDLYGKNLKQLQKTKKFIQKLKLIFPKLQIESIDERFTSFEADNILEQLLKNPKNTKKDDISAILILESYLKSQKIY